MDRNTLNYVVETTHDLIDAHTCSSETRAAALAWLEALGTDREAEETKKYIAELEADIMPIDTLIAFAESEGGKKVFGDAAPNVAAHAREVKAAGGKFCDCPACVAVAKILEKKSAML